MPSTELSPEEQLAGHAEALLSGLATHLPGWVERTLAEHLGSNVDRTMLVGLEPAVDETLDEVARLLRTDVDAQRANPLAIVRRLTDAVTVVLDEAGVPQPVRDPDAVRIFPGDHYDIVPATFSDIHPDLHLPGLTWGAAKAHLHISRRRAEGLRP